MRLLPILAVLLACAGTASIAQAAPDLVLRGVLTGADHQTYRTVPFAVPPGVARITIEFDYTGKEERSVIDLGLLGPDGALAGWSGGNKRVFTVSSTDATPSYHPMPTVPGQWALLLGIPNMRAAARAEYTAQVTFSRGLAAADEPELLRAPLRSGPAWYRGDLHSHTGHSDGSCASSSSSSGSSGSSSSAKVPCPLFLTAQAANTRKLDFIAVTEHNGTTHAHGIRELQPYFDQLLLIPGRELTSFHGHANFFGSTAPLDFRIGPGAQRDWNGVLAGAAALGGLVSINHPVRPSGENCMGCGWEQDSDMRLVQAIEAVNGRDADSPWSGIPFWEKQLARGYRITAIGGSDNHDASLHGAAGVGSPTTVVYARELSQTALLEAIRAGHVFIDIEGSTHRALELQAQTGAAKAGAGQGGAAMMGDALAAPSGVPVNFSVRVAGAQGGRIETVMDGAAVPLLAQPGIDVDDARKSFSWTSDGKPHWLRTDVRDAAGKLILLGNPVYLNAVANSREAGAPGRR